MTLEKIRHLLTSAFHIQVSTYDGKSTVDVTGSFVKMSLGCIQGSFIDLSVLRNATKVILWLRHSSHAALTELEIFTEGKELWER